MAILNAYAVPADFLRYREESAKTGKIKIPEGHTVKSLAEKRRLVLDKLRVFGEKKGFDTLCCKEFPVYDNWKDIPLYNEEKDPVDERVKVFKTKRDLELKTLDELQAEEFSINLYKYTDKCYERFQEMRHLCNERYNRLQAELYDQLDIATQKRRESDLVAHRDAYKCFVDVLKQHFSLGSRDDWRLDKAAYHTLIEDCKRQGNIQEYIQVYSRLEYILACFRWNSLSDYDRASLRNSWPSIKVGKVNGRYSIEKPEFRERILLYTPKDLSTDTWNVLQVEESTQNRKRTAATPNKTTTKSIDSFFKKARPTEDHDSKTEQNWANYLKSNDISNMAHPNGRDRFPDFLLNDSDSYMEVKPSCPSLEERRKALKMDKPVFFVWGRPGPWMSETRDRDSVYGQYNACRISKSESISWGWFLTSDGKWMQDEEL